MQRATEGEESWVEGKPLFSGIFHVTKGTWLLWTNGVGKWRSEKQDGADHGADKDQEDGEGS